MNRNHYIEIYESYTGSRGRFYIELFSEDGYGYLWRSPRYRWYWVARCFGRRDARAYLSRKPTQFLCFIDKRDKFVKRLKL